VLLRSSARRALALLAIAGTSCARQPRSHTVAIRDFKYEPASITVAPGDTVVWTNADFVPHTVTARDTTFDSKSLGGNATWTFVAETAGQHVYYCVFHPNMTATIDVQR
jgi:plastocyanin